MLVAALISITSNFYSVVSTVFAVDECLVRKTVYHLIFLYTPKPETINLFSHLNHKKISNKFKVWHIYSFWLLQISACIMHTLNGLNPNFVVLKRSIFWCFIKKNSFPVLWIDQWPSGNTWLDYSSKFDLWILKGSKGGPVQKWKVKLVRFIEKMEKMTFFSKILD